MQNDDNGSLARAMQQSHDEDKIHHLERRIAQLEKFSHEPFDFTDLINRLEHLEAITGVNK